MVDQQKTNDENQSEKIAILWAARKNKESRWQQVLVEIESLKAQNHNQTIRINQLENKLQLIGNKPPISKSNYQSQMNVAGSSSSKDQQIMPPSNCQDLFTI